MFSPLFSLYSVQVQALSPQNGVDHFQRGSSVFLKAAKRHREVCFQVELMQITCKVKERAWEGGSSVKGSSGKGKDLGLIPSTQVKNKAQWYAAVIPVLGLVRCSAAGGSPHLLGSQPSPTSEVWVH